MYPAHTWLKLKHEVLITHLRGLDGKLNMLDDTRSLEEDPSKMDCLRKMLELVLLEEKLAEANTGSVTRNRRGTNIRTHYS